MYSATIMHYANKYNKTAATTYSTQPLLFVSLQQTTKTKT